MSSPFPSSLLHVPGVVFLPIGDEPQPVALSIVWSPHNQSLALRNMLNAATSISRTLS